MGCYRVQLSRKSRLFVKYMLQYLQGYIDTLTYFVLDVILTPGAR